MQRKNHLTIIKTSAIKHFRFFLRHIENFFFHIENFKKKAGNTLYKGKGYYTHANLEIWVVPFLG